MDYKDLTGEEVKLFYKFNNYAFGPVKNKESSSEKQKEYTPTGELKGLYKDSRLKACYQLFPVECRLRDHWLQTGLIGNVTSPPENRRKGYVARMLKEAIKEMKERGLNYSLLWPFSYTFYRNYGWEQVSVLNKYVLNPGFLAFTEKMAAGEFRKVSAGDFKELNSVYSSFYTDYTLEMKRKRDWWQEQIFSLANRKLYCYIWEYGGQPEGYLVYYFQQGEREYWERDLVVREIHAVNFKAFINLLRFLYYHDSQARKIKFFTPLNYPLFKKIPDPRIDELKYVPGVMGRIIDVRNVLEEINYPVSQEINIKFRLQDKCADWNRGNYFLNVDPEGKGRCGKIEANSETDFTIKINHLTALVTGFLSGAEAFELGYIKTDDDKTIDILEKLFPACKTYFIDDF